jgi:uncharacterized UPF0160 family protein
MLEETPIIVHSGHFHADEVMAVAIARMLGVRERVIRTRDPKIIAEWSRKAYILDVGGVDDPEALRFDHHQAGFDRYFSEHAKELGVKMSSCGLFYHWLGPNIFGMFMGSADIAKDLADGWRELVPDGETLQKWYEHFYNKYIMEIDANDNGVSQTKPGIIDAKVFRYTRSWNLASIVKAFNNLDTSDTGPAAEAQDEAFTRAVDACREIMERIMYHFIADKIALERGLRRLRTIRTGSEHGDYIMNIDDRAILVLNDNFDYTDAARELLYGNTDSWWCFTVLPREAGKNDPEADNWQVHTVNITGHGFANRASIVDRETATTLIGSNLVFLHNNRFIAVTKGRDAAIALAYASAKASYRTSLVVTAKICIGLGIAILSIAIGFTIRGQ